MNLDLLGWRQEFDPYFYSYQQQGFQVGRVIEEQRNLYTIMMGTDTKVHVNVSGRFRYEAANKRDFPVVGDWVIYRQVNQEEKGVIHSILPRFSKFSRKSAGNTTEEQVLAANIDTVFLVNSLINDFNLRRLERYLVMARESGANPVIVLSKADLCDDVEHKISLVQQFAPAIPTHVISVVNRQGIEALDVYCQPGQTIAMLGSSGVGKSTLMNCLSEQDIMAVGAVRAHDGLGKHTTTHRQLVMLPRGGMIIDTPGMRELQLWTNKQVDYNFQDVQSFAVRCKYRDCLHQGEAGCEVERAIQSGQLSAERFKSYMKLQKESQHLERKENEREQLKQKVKMKKLFQSIDRKRKRF
ncbi:ribosome small subunit-dependent GTPase [Paenibacillus helianthi]|uniref:Small ribosomal subunit biogenesis GTPase RsgA n=1 Tax=Paenibacillus helianthi TaxID=1349432 RepID=A0ABX3EF55_9BACL|nr:MULTISPECIES: ribosome small subunit-dependent GTPase A [Paenibacillus]OKP79506.1 ribosome small subunit-dependent GTPase [Paenibacillus helianthi]OKP94750.1 ribosome small subunit-dependent GTPase [Paenibacillus sp. P32E]